jgi:predicted MFS family arabinose efflux permease
LNAFLIERYHIATGDLAPILALAGVGLLIGSQVGGRLGDRVGHKPVALAAIAVATAFMVLQLWTDTNIYIAGAINFVMSLPMGMRFVSMSALISEAVPTARGTMNAMNSAFFNVGIMFGAFGGGQIVEQIGFPALGVLCALAHVASIGILGLFLVEARGDSEPAPERPSVLAEP